MARIKTILWSRKDSEGQFPVKIRITKGKQSKYVPLGFSLKKSEWNTARQEVRTTHTDHVRLNDLVTKRRREIEDIAEQLRPENPSADLIWRVASGELRISGNKLNRLENIDFYSFTEKVIARLDEAGQHRNARNTQVMLNKLRGFLGAGVTSLPFGLLTVSLLKDFESHLLANGNVRNTVAKDFSRLRKVINDAIDEEWMDIGANPFLRFKVKRGKPAAKVKLSADELRALFEVPTKSGTRLRDAQNIFKFQFFIGGIRIGDCLMLRWDNIRNDRVDYRMTKTQSSPSIPLQDSAKDILKEYAPNAEGRDSFIFPFLNNDRDYSDLKYLQKQIEAKTALINKNLKILARKAGIEKNISTHVARHSMADFLRRNSRDLFAISKVLGHSSIKITEGYLSSLDQQELDDTIATLKILL